MNKAEPTRKGSSPIKVYCLPDEKVQIEAAAKTTNLSASDFLRRIGLGFEVRCVIDQQRVLDLAKINADQGRLGGLLKLWLTNDERLLKFGSPWTQATIKALLARIGANQVAMLEVVKKL